MPEVDGNDPDDDPDSVPAFAGTRFSESRNVFVGADGRALELRPKSLEVLRYLAARPERVTTKEEILAAVWEGVCVTDDSLVQCISEIRRVLGDTDRRVLQTVPRRGYVLMPDETRAVRRTLPRQGHDLDTDAASADEPARTEAAVSAVPADIGAMGTDGGVDGDARPGFVPASPSLRRSRRLLPVMALAILLGGIVILVQDGSRDRSDTAESSAGNAVAADGILDIDSARTSVSGPGDARADAAPSLRLMTSDGEAGGGRVAALGHAVRTALGRYRTVRLSEASSTDLVLELAMLDAQGTRVAAELRAPKSDTLLFVETFDLPDADAEALFSVRLAAMIASPASGHLARHLLARSRDKNPETLSAAECYAQGYDCTNCSGELDSVNRSAEVCLARLIRENPNDARAWALQATLHAHQYQWGTNLVEPAYSDLDARARLPALAIAAANRAEQLSDGGDTSVYWGMAQAYQTSCEVDKLSTAVERGLAINPDDPSLLAVFGNWLTYAGEWDRGAALTERALEIEPRHYRRWWLFAIAKRHYARGEYEQALEWFRKAFNERNWLSHLQLAYTLPHLGRLEEARKALARAEALLPGVTIEFAVQLYAVYCFPEDYIARMVAALESIGMPSRGDYSNLRDPEVAHARVLTIGDWDVEYMDLGDGVPLVFVHGAMSDYRSWGHYQNPVSAKYRYISYSRRYHGSQPWPDAGERSGPAHAGRDLGEFIDALGFERVFLVGWSSGADPLLHFALDRPERVAGIVLYEPVIDTVADETDEGFPRAARDRFFARFGRVTAHLEAGHEEAATRAFLENVFEYPDGGFEREIMAIRRVVLDNVRTVPLHFARWESVLGCEDLSGVTAPTLVVGGERTHPYWQYLSRKFARCIPGADFAVLEGVRHDGPIRRPPALFALIDDFVARHTR